MSNITASTALLVQISLARRVAGVPLDSGWRWHRPAVVSASGVVTSGCWVDTDVAVVP